MIFFIQAEFLTNSHTGQEITVEFVLEPDYGQVSKTFKVGEPEDNTQDNDDPGTSTFTKYLTLQKTNVRQYSMVKFYKGFQNKNVCFTDGANIQSC